MPRQAKPPRLYLRRSRKNAAGDATHQSVWCIRDGDVFQSTGCRESDRHGAEKRLAAYLQQKHDPYAKRGGHPDEIELADVLNIYLTEKAPSHARPSETAARVFKLLEWWGSRFLADISESSCRAYAKSRGGGAASRRELEDLRSAITYFGKTNGVNGTVSQVWLPDKPMGRTRWLTRSEAATFLKALWRARDPLTGEYTRRHVARFFLVGLYTGTRAGAICGAAIGPSVSHGFVNLDSGLFYRRPARARETNKRQPTCRLPRRLMAHLERWHRIGASRRFVVEYHGKPVRSVRKAWDSTRRETGLHDVMRHTLRHTAATWAMQNGANIFDAAGYLGMSTETLSRNYAHHHPDYQADASARITASPQKRHSFGWTKAEHSNTRRNTSH